MKNKSLKNILMYLLIIAVLTFSLTSCGSSVSSDSNGTATVNYVGNIRNHKLHSINCTQLPYEDNCVYFSTIEEAYSQGYTDRHKECMGN